MIRDHAVRQRAAARDALTARTRRLTGGALTVSALLTGAFAGIAAATAPGKQLHAATTSTRTPTSTKATTTKKTHATTVRTAIPPLPAPPGPGNLSAPPPAPTPAPASTPVQAQAPPVVVSGGS